MKYDGTHGNGYQPIDGGDSTPNPPTTGSKAISPTKPMKDVISDVFKEFKAICITNDADCGTCIVDEQYEMTITMKKMIGE